MVLSRALLFQPYTLPASQAIISQLAAIDTDGEPHVMPTAPDKLACRFCHGNRTSVSTLEEDTEAAKAANKALFSAISKEKRLSLFDTP